MGITFVPTLQLVSSSPLIPGSIQGAFQLPQPGPGQSRHLPALKGDRTPASLSWSLEGPSVQRGKDRSFQDQQLWKFWKLRCNVALELGR